MGCCTAKLSSNKPKTLRDPADNQILNNDTKGEQTYVGKKVKEVLDESDVDDLMLAVVNNQSQLVEALCLKFKVLNVCELRGLKGQFELLKREQYNLQNWNMILAALAYNHMFALKFFTKNLQCHLRVALRSPPVHGFSRMQEYSPQCSEAFPILVAINNRNDDCLKYLWNDLYRLWDSFHLEYVLDECASNKYVDGLKILLKSETAHNIYLSMRVQDKIQMLSNLLLHRQSKRNLEVKETLKDEFSQHPYATHAILVMVNDPKGGYTQNSIHMEKALGNMDPAEYARYKYNKNKGTFNDDLLKRLNEMSQQEENQQMKKFADNLKNKFEHLDGEIAKLKGGFVNAVDYDEVLTKLFEYTEQNDLQNFSKKVQENDIRLFKRKRMLTIELTKSFGINRYCSFTPLLHAVQNKCLTIVSFVMERVKCGLRQALCLQTTDNDENFMGQDVNEEYQAYSLLVACANKDEQMLRYLWNDHGTYLWTERHFEPVMRYLIESEWLDGIRIMFRSDLTVQMIKGFTADERSFFIENMIGDLFSIEKPSVVSVLKEELSYKPYAGLFIVYMLTRDFEKLQVEDFKSWETACDNLYLQELKVLSKTNQSSFSKFILDFYVKRKDDEVRMQAMKFVEKLKELPEYEPIIEEGTEELVQNGDEEVRFLRKDLRSCTLDYMLDLVKYTITGNVKQIQKILDKEGLNEQDLFDVRGFAAKAYDYENSIINTREWNPVTYAIFFRQHKTLAYYIDELKVNLKIAMDYSHTYNEFIEDPSFRQFFGDYTHLYGFLLAVWTKDLQMLKYLYEEKQLQVQLNDQDLLKLMKICIKSGFAKGFMSLLNSSVTQSIFVNSSLDGKKELVQYILSDECIESETINSQKTDQTYREVKETLCLWPYCSISWLYIDPSSTINKRYTQLMIENFDQRAMVMLSKCGHLEKLESLVTRPNIAVDFLTQVKDEEDQKEMKERHAEIQQQREIQMQHQQKFITKIREEKQKEGNNNVIINSFKLYETCQDIVEQILNSSEIGQEEKKKKFFEKMKNFKMMQFVCGFSSFQFWRKYPKLQSIDMDRLNVLHWVLFFDQDIILEQIMHNKDEGEDRMDFGMAIASDHFEFEYEFTNLMDKKQHKIVLKRLGTVVCVMQRSSRCWRKLFEKSETTENLILQLSAQEILDLVLVICAEGWKEGISPLVDLIESAFCKMSLIKRVTFIHNLLGSSQDGFKDVIRIPKLLTFVEWMYENYRDQERFNLNHTIKTLLPSFQVNKEQEFKKIQFLARLKPAEVVADIQQNNNKNIQRSNTNKIHKNNQEEESPRDEVVKEKVVVAPNDIINLNDIKIVEKKKNMNVQAQYVPPRSMDPSPNKNGGSDDSAEADSD